MTEKEFVKNVIDGKKLDAIRLLQLIRYERFGRLPNALEQYNQTPDKLPLTKEEYDYFVKNVYISGKDINEWLAEEKNNYGNSKGN